MQLANGDERMNTLACNRSNLVIPIFNIETYTTIFTLFNLKGKRLHSFQSKVSHIDCDPSHIEAVEVRDTTFIINCRVYRYFDMLVIAKNRLHLIREAVLCRKPHKASNFILVNHSLTVRPLKRGIEVIISQRDYWVETHTIMFN